MAARRSAGLNSPDRSPTRVFLAFAPFVRLPVRNITAYRDGVAGVPVLGDEDAMGAFLHGMLTGDLDGGVQVVFNGVGVVGGNFRSLWTVRVMFTGAARSPTGKVICAR